MRLFADLRGSQRREVGAGEQPLVGLIFASSSGSRTALKESNRGTRGLNRMSAAARSGHGRTIEPRYGSGSGGGRALRFAVGHQVALAGARGGFEAGGEAGGGGRGA